MEKNTIFLEVPVPDQNLNKEQKIPSGEGWTGSSIETFLRARYEDFAKISFYRAFPNIGDLTIDSLMGILQNLGADSQLLQNNSPQNWIDALNQNVLDDPILPEGTSSFAYLVPQAHIGALRRSIKSATVGPMLLDQQKPSIGQQDARRIAAIALNLQSRLPKIIALTPSRGAFSMLIEDVYGGPETFQEDDLKNLKCQIDVVSMPFLYFSQRKIAEEQQENWYPHVAFTVGRRWDRQSQTRIGRYIREYIEHSDVAFKVEAKNLRNPLEARLPGGGKNH